VSEWIEHDGGGMPVPGDTHVEVKFRDGDILTGQAGYWDSEGDDGTNWRFVKSDPDFDIVAYRIISNPDSTPTPP
jgi:hypothetical protein